MHARTILLGHAVANAPSRQAHTSAGCNSRTKTYVQHLRVVVNVVGLLTIVAKAECMQDLPTRFFTGDAGVNSLRISL